LRRAIKGIEERWCLRRQHNPANFHQDSCWLSVGDSITCLFACLASWQELSALRRHAQRQHSILCLGKSIPSLYTFSKSLDLTPAHLLKHSDTNCVHTLLPYTSRARACFDVLACLIRLPTSRKDVAKAISFAQAANGLLYRNRIGCLDRCQ
jgi:hypothetical protein